MSFCKRLPKLLSHKAFYTTPFIFLSYLQPISKSIKKLNLQKLTKKHGRVASSDNIHHMIGYLPLINIFHYKLCFVVYRNEKRFEKTYLLSYATLIYKSDNLKLKIVSAEENFIFS